mgnify:CR=1 FL=1|tara:strand:+ start:174 stop:500 length:327 start_codon:yes stop_codon:yes gene_type:complete
MTNISNEYRHQKIAELLAIMWQCNDADSNDHAPNWTIPKMSHSVVEPLIQAIKAMLDPEYDDFLIGGGLELSRSDYKEKVLNGFFDDHCQDARDVTSIIDFVLVEYSA